MSYHFYMDKVEIGRKAAELNAILVKYKSDLGMLEKELLKAIDEYHTALKEERLRELKASITNAG